MKSLYLAWRQPDRRWWPVGHLTRHGSDYVFAYTRGAISAEEAGFRPLLTFPDRDEVYVSKDLFPLFTNRLPPKSRPDYQNFVEWLDVGPGEADPMVLLARSGGRRETDMFEVFPGPERSPEGRYDSSSSSTVCVTGPLKLKKKRRVSSRVIASSLCPSPRILKTVTH